MAHYTQLHQYYTDNNTTLIPFVLKPNDVGDPDYVAPVQDLAMCPIPASGDDLIITNFQAVTILDVILRETGQPDIALLVNVPSGQSKTVKVTGNKLYNSIVIRLSSVPSQATLMIAPGSGGSAMQQITPVTLIAVEFFNVTLGTPVAADITLS
jgi:hypothetical protein